LLFVAFSCPYFFLPSSLLSSFPYFFPFLTFPLSSFFLPSLTFSLPLLFLYFSLPATAPFLFPFFLPFLATTAAAAMSVDARKRRHSSPLDDHRSPKRVSAKDSPAKDAAPTKPKSSAALLPDILTRSGGVYIPPARLRQLQASLTDKSSEAYQRMCWDALKKSINGLINKVNNKH
jgi:hypothetical protein